MDGFMTRHFDYLNRIWKFRYFWCALVSHDLRNRYKRSFLGIGWSLLKPLSMTVIYCMVFGNLFGVPLDEYAPYVLIGVTVWQFLTESILQGTTSLTSSSPYIRQQSVPMAIFPLRTVISSAIHAAIAITVGLAVALFFGAQFHPFALLNLIPALVILFFIGWCLAIITGVVYTHFPDTRYILEVALQILFYITPILYKPELLAERTRLGKVLEWNPMTSILALVRVPILEGTPPSWQHVLMSVAFLLVCATFAMMLLRKLERELIFWI